MRGPGAAAAPAAGGRRRGAGVQRWRARTHAAVLPPPQHGAARWPAGGPARAPEHPGASLALPGASGSAAGPHRRPTAALASDDRLPATEGRGPNLARPQLLGASQLWLHAARGPWPCTFAPPYGLTSTPPAAHHSACASSGARPLRRICRSAGWLRAPSASARAWPQPMKLLQAFPASRRSFGESYGVERVRERTRGGLGVVRAGGSAAARQRRCEGAQPPTHRLASQRLLASVRAPPPGAAACFWEGQPPGGPAAGAGAAALRRQQCELHSQPRARGSSFCGSFPRSEGASPPPPGRRWGAAAGPPAAPRRGS